MAATRQALNKASVFLKKDSDLWEQNSQGPMLLEAQQ